MSKKYYLKYIIVDIMRCNIFKPLSNDTGEFFMFSQYTDDLTKEDAAKGSYRVVPSRFAVLELNVNNFKTYMSGHEGSGEDPYQDQNLNRYLSQYLQSYYENSVCLAKEVLGYDTANKEMYWDEDNLNDGYATQLLWKSLEDWGLISRASVTTLDGSYNTFKELKFIGDINIHSNRQADGMNYNDIYCYISPSDNEMAYELADVSGFVGKDGSVSSFALSHGNPGDPDHYDYSQVIMGWTKAAYPINNGGIDEKPRSESGFYNLSGRKYPIMNNSSASHIVEHQENEEAIGENKEFSFNCIIVFYDIYNDLDLEDGPVCLHYNRPLGIYFTGPINMEYFDTGNQDTPGSIPLRNQVTKYVSNEDIFGQGTGWSVRLMTRVVATPNSSTYAMVVDGGDDYETVAGAMGRIADAIADIRTDMRLQSENYQLMKDHLAIFKNYRTNIPYVRSIVMPNEGPVEFWFVNGRNTGQRVYLPEPILYEFTVWNQDGTQQYGAGVAEVVDDTNIYTIIKFISDSSDESRAGSYFKVNESINDIDSIRIPLLSVDDVDTGMSIMMTRLYV